jgi:hypothetical protein
LINFNFIEEDSSQDVSDQIPGDGTDNEEVSSEEQPSSSDGRQKCICSIVNINYFPINDPIYSYFSCIMSKFSDEDGEKKTARKTTQSAKERRAPPPSSKTGKPRKADSISSDEDTSSEEDSEGSEEEREIDSDNDAVLYARRLEDLSEDDLDDGLEGVEDGDDSDEDDEKEQQLAMQLQ